MVPVEAVGEEVEVVQHPAYQLDSWFSAPAYLTTMYFVDPSLICAGGRTQDQYDSQGTGDRLVVQVDSLQFVQKLELQTKISQSRRSEKSPTWAFSWLKVPTSTFTFKTLFSKGLKQVDMKKGCRAKVIRDGRVG